MNHINQSLPSDTAGLTAKRTGFMLALYEKSGNVTEHAPISFTLTCRLGGGLIFITFALSPPNRRMLYKKSSAHKRANRLTWLCCCWSLSWRIAWASPPVALPVSCWGMSVEAPRTKTKVAGERRPVDPLLSLKRPRVARTHMGKTNVTDMLDNYD